MSVVFFVSPRFYPNGTIKLVHGAEFNFPTKLGYNNFIPFGFVNSVEGNSVRQKNGVLGVNVNHNGWRAFIPIPVEIANGLKKFNLLGTQGIKESHEQTSSVREYTEKVFSSQVPPELVKQASEFKEVADKGKPILQMLNVAAVSANAGITTQMVTQGTKAAAPKIGQGITKIATRVAPKVVAKIAPVLARGAPWLLKGALVTVADYLAWPVAILTGAHMFYEYNRDRDFQKSVEILSEKKAYKPDIAIAAALALMKKSGEYFVGSEAKVLSAVIDNAVLSGKANPVSLRQEWSKKLNYTGKNLKETKLVRVLAATILGRRDVVSDNLSIAKPENSQTFEKIFSNEDRLAIRQMYISTSTARDTESKVLASVSKSNDVEYKRVGLGYHSVQAPFMGGTIKAIPDFVSFKGETKWQITLTTGYGITSIFYKTLDRQFNLKDLAPGTSLQKTFETSVSKQRAQFTKTPAYIKPWQGKLYGNPVSAKPLYMQKDGSIMWQVTATSNGVTKTIYESLGLTNQTGYQFDSSDVQRGRIVKIRFDNIFSGK